MSKLAVTLDKLNFEVLLDWIPQDGNRLVVEIGGEKVPVILPDSEAAWDALEWIIVDGRPLELAYDAGLRWIRTNGSVYPVEVRDLEMVVARTGWGDGRVQAPIPGLITRILVEEGQPVRAGQPVLVLEAMKMENEIHAPLSGVVKGIHVCPGRTVVKQQLLLEISLS